ncbi:MAG: hypothetical protein ABI543_12155 [Ignavibacteria bacterium]
MVRNDPVTLKNINSLIIILLISLLLYSCGKDNAVNNVNNETLLYQEQGLVDSAVVTGCYAYTRSHFLNDTFSFSGYSKIKVEFDGFSTSDHATISVLSNTVNVTNEVLYSSNNENVNMYHSFEIAIPSDSVWLELRLYMNPQVCGQNEFKYIRARDLKVSGVR